MTPLQPLRVGDARLAFAPDVTHVMAVINLSPESRVRHSVVTTPDEALARAREYRELGASIIDLGAQSSHYENEALTPQAELERLLPALRLLAADGFVVAVDTWKAQVARAAVEAGAAILNDTGGLADPEMVEIAVRRDVPALLMHIEGPNPLAVDRRELTGDRPAVVAQALAARAAELRARGIRQLIVDPGLSINYRSDYEAYGRLQLETIRRLDELRATGAPVLVPVPRKQELHRMVAYLVLSLEHGADIVRVHDVGVACDLVALLGRRLGAVER